MLQRGKGAFCRISSKSGAMRVVRLVRFETLITSTLQMPYESIALDLLQKYVLESGFEFHVTDGSNQIET